MRSSHVRDAQGHKASVEQKEANTQQLEKVSIKYVESQMDYHMKTNTQQVYSTVWINPQT